jgi:imidazolonepropionase
LKNLLNNLQGESMRQKIRVFEDIGELLTLDGAERKGGRQVKESDLSSVHDAVMVCVDGRVKWIGRRADFHSELLRPFGGERDAESVSLGGRTVLPGFVECHTHLVFAGDRSSEFEWRLQGQTYQEISAKGGGILSTVRETRAASRAVLQGLAQARADVFCRQGVTCLEVKSGYGLDLDTEIRSLQVAALLQGPRVVKTYLGAHSRSPDFPDLALYMKEMIDVVLPRIAREGLADRVDIYIEKGFYDLELARAYLQKATDLGLPVTAHTEQLSESGGTDLVLDFEPQSVDHLVYLNEAALTRLARSRTTAVLLPASDFYLKMRYPPARSLIDGGACVALSTDFNPGTSPTQDLSLVGVLARLEMKMTLAEVLCAYTLGAAAALGKGSELGSLTPGKYCDFSVLDGSWRELFYSVGHHPVQEVYRSGERVQVS